jgi:hypothetical protein
MIVKVGEQAKFLQRGFGKKQAGRGLAIYLGSGSCHQRHPF